MRRSIPRPVLAVVVVALTIWACGDNGTVDTPTSPTEPVETVTETFAGTLTPNGARTFPFSALAGAVTATLTTLGPDSTLAVGLSLGTWSGSVCQIVLANDNAVQGSIVVGEASTISSLCVRVYDVGNLDEPLDFVVTVTHR